MISKIKSCALYGINGYLVDVEVDLSEGLPGFDLVGLPDSSIRESKERVRAAIKNSEFLFPIKRITVNLAPADTKKEGSAFDLPIAIGIISCNDPIDKEILDSTMIIGELSLDGKVRPVNGILPMVYSALKKGIKQCIVPFENAEEGAIVEDIEVIGVHTLKEAINHLKKEEIIPRTIIDINSLMKNNTNNTLDFADVKGQEHVKRALEISAAGSHNVLMIGPPGSGKTMMARRLPTILPDLSFEESIEITKIYSVTGLLPNKKSLITSRPFRAPHHTVSNSALIGGGRIPKPGEVSLSHYGVLFLDELPEFNKNVLEVLRQPLEDREVTISRVNATLTYPASFMLVCSMNPCPCGYLGDDEKCHCQPEQVKKYLSKISGPLLDRLDIHVEASPVKYDDLDVKEKSESSASIKKRVLQAQKIQQERYKNESIYFNAQLSASQIDKYCVLGKEERDLLKNAFEKLNLSARAYHRILKVSRTIADLEGEEKIGLQHLSEAIQYRSLDRKYWA
ncbi:YifB family Mg chelatase-like AAA ATPase [Defluviitalea phaphyphila]|uniref:YifB family Mg chelatase-like AAA ATPase n=1 Tax=Defluviitalea phaphyphila TaxID=1473580 RepID=UPI000730A85B|nr:YifB family Mg chelatase-like AAA ATPase [Defluviitalea phaphyphila]